MLKLLVYKLFANVKLSKRDFIVIFVIENIQNIGMEWMHSVDVWKTI